MPDNHQWRFVALGEPEKIRAFMTWLNDVVENSTNPEATALEQQKYLATVCEVMLDNEFRLPTSRVRIKNGLPDRVMFEGVSTFAGMENSSIDILFRSVFKKATEELKLKAAVLRIGPREGDSYFLESDDLRVPMLRTLGPQTWPV